MIGPHVARPDPMSCAELSAVAAERSWRQGESGAASQTPLRSAYGTAHTVAELCGRVVVTLEMLLETAPSFVGMRRLR